jgi:hypothetical protein
MMRLTTYSQKQSDERSVFVLWRVGISNFGVLTVEFTHPIEDIELAAELVAIRHLVFNQAVFDRIPDSGKAFELNVSKGAIKKLSSIDPIRSICSSLQHSCRKEAFRWCQN